MMKISWFTVLLCYVALRSCEAVNLEEVHNTTSTSGVFCVTVQDRIPEPANLTSEERQRWISAATINVRFYVTVTRLHPYTTCASQRKLDKNLTLGNHFVEYKQIVSKEGLMVLALTLDGDPMEAQDCSEKVYDVSGHLEQFKIFAKGPLHFTWDDRCPETTRAPTTLLSTSTSTSSPGRSTRDTLPNTTLLITSVTPNPFPVTTAPPDIITASPTLGQGGLPIWAWIVAGAVLVAVTVIGIGCCYACARHRRHKRQMRRRTDAEKVKQTLLVDAKRMSYQEQMRWDMGRVDTGAVPASQEFSYNMTTFSDLN